MKSSSKNNLILAAVLIVIGIFAYWFEFKEKAVIDRKNDAKTKVFAFDTNTEFSKVHIVDNKAKVDYSFGCVDRCHLSDVSSKWKITAPISFKADEGNVGSFISNISNAIVSEKIPLEGNVNPASFGLAPDKRNDFKVEISVKGNDVPYTIYFGDQSVVGQNLYSLVERPDHSDSKNILIVPGYLKASLEKGLNYWRNKRVFEFSQTDLETMTLNSKIKIFKKEGTWFLKEGSSADLLADSDTVNSFITGLTYMNAVDYASDDRMKDAAKFNIKRNPDNTLELVLKNQETLKLSIFNVKKNGDSKIYATLSNQNYILELDKPSAEKFNKQFQFFKYRRLITVVEKQETKKIKVILSEKEKFEFEKGEDGSWKLVSGVISEFDSKKFDQSVNKIGSAVIGEFLINNKVPEKAKQVATWEFYDEKSKLIRGFKAYTVESEMIVKLQTGDLAKMEQSETNHVPYHVSDFSTMAKVKMPPVPPMMPPKK